MRTRRLVQWATLLLFLVLLLRPQESWIPLLPADIFQRLDPLLGLLTCISARGLLWFAWPALLVLGVTFFFGRLFCSHVCPLGTTLDLTNKVTKTKPSAFGRREWKYLFLVALLTAAALGMNFAHLGAPLSLAPRLYGLLVFPFATLLGMESLAEAPRYALTWAHAGIFLFILGSVRITPRWWCRNLCPAGAMLALCTGKKATRRHVDHACNDCGKCRRTCPMGAIDANDPRQTTAPECIQCRRCRDICPQDAVSFPRGPEERPQKHVFASRRALLGAVVGGGAAVFTARTDVASHSGDADVGEITPERLIRPPGSMPEDAFQRLCLRCGLCMTACPTNMLHPDGMSIGVNGLFAPVAMPRRGPCDPECTNCGRACPSGAIRPLPKEERQAAKMGTAVITPNKCLAWEMDRSCLVCDEACPYGAISLKKVAGNTVAVPVVDEMKCAGCGYCEFRCPVRGTAAIVVTPMAALRLGEGSFMEEGARIGLSISRKGEGGHGAYGAPADEEFEGLPPGFEE